MRIHRIGAISANQPPLQADTVERPRPEAHEVLIRVEYCGVCRTELDEIEGRAAPPRLPMTPGHQVIGTVTDEGAGCRRGLLGQRVGMAWIHSSCGTCAWCRHGLENLCPQFRACGRDAHGGYAEYACIPENFAHTVPAALPGAAAAPLLCAGAVGLRALRLCGLENGRPLGLTGFGASGHLVLQMARHLYPESPVLVFARSEAERHFALQLGADWAGDTSDPPPTPMMAAIDTTPAWQPVLSALGHLEPGGRLVINAIRKEPGDRDLLLGLDYERHLWREKHLATVANVTRADVRDCLDLAVQIGLEPEIRLYALTDANRALLELKTGRIRGAKVLRVSPESSAA